MAFLDEHGLARAWQNIKNYIDTKVNCGSIEGEAQDSSPVGTIISWLGHSAPDDYLPCDGTTYNIAEYKTLADFIETEFGATNYFGGDGTTTFAVPDMTGRFLFGSNTEHEIAQAGGSEEVALTVEQMPRHYHIERTSSINNETGEDTSAILAETIYGLQNEEWGEFFAKNDTNNNSVRRKSLVPGVVNTEETGGYIDAWSGETISVRPHSNMPPYFTVLICIKAK